MRIVQESKAHNDRQSPKENNGYECDRTGEAQSTRYSPENAPDAQRHPITNVSASGRMKKCVKQILEADNYEQRSENREQYRHKLDGLAVALLNGGCGARAGLCVASFG